MLTINKHYNYVAREKTAARQADYHSWVRSHTPQEINAANNARQQLRRLLKNVGKRRYPPHTSKIVDDRQPKRPRTPFILFTVERWATGDLKNIKTSEAAKLISEEWKALSAGEKKVRIFLDFGIVSTDLVTEIRGRVCGEQGKVLA
jgi:hypothetical protein